MRALLRTTVTAAAAIAGLLLAGCNDDFGGAVSPDSAGNPQALWIDPNQNPGTRPPLPPELRDPFGYLIADISAGDFHTCVRRFNGTAYCWGRDDLGQAGGGPTQTTCAVPMPCIPTPARVGSWLIGSVNAIDAGADHTCALDPTGAAFCWGGGNVGQLGIASGTYMTSGSGAVAGGIVFTSISAGVWSTCGTSASGLFCWGRIRKDLAIPDQVTGHPDYFRVAVGDGNACMVDVTGIVDCFGANLSGQAGFDPRFSSNALLRVGSAAVTDAFHVSTFGPFTCVDKAGGSVECFGDNRLGQLGVGTFTSTHNEAPVASADPLHGVSVGREHACALDPNGQAFCWGRNRWGQLGTQSGVSSSVPTPVITPNGERFKLIAAGNRHTCAVGFDERVYCWGDNSFAQLGRGIITPLNNPLVPWPTDPF